MEPTVPDPVPQLEPQKAAPTSGGGWWLAVSRERSVIAAMVMLVVALAAMVWVIQRTQRDLIDVIAVEQATQVSTALAEFRQLYTSEVTARVGGHGIDVLSDYASTDGAIPLPATLTILLGKRIGERGTGVSVSLYSDFPFSTRVDGGPQDDFQRNALVRLEQDSETPFYAEGFVDGRPVLRYATADILHESCVDCHNSHPDSPKTDWKTGDVRGVLEVTVPLDAAISQANRNLTGLFALLLAFGLGGFGILVFTTRKLQLRMRDALETVEQLGRYKLEEKIGEGGMGEVYRARHTLLRRPAAVKLVRSDGLDEAISRFEREAQETAKLRCPHTVNLYDFGIEDDGTFYYVMELLEGLELDSMVRKFGPMPAERVVYLLRQVCESLEEAHHRGLVHRDIKPANLFCCQYGLQYDFIKVLDFGLVKESATSAEKSAGLTIEGVALGTPGYMAPESLLGERKLHGVVDIYALGCVAYWLLTGREVFTADNSMMLAIKHVDEEANAPSTCTELPIPVWLDELVLACLAKKPEDRPRTTTEIIERLDANPIEPRWNAARAASWWQRHIPKASP